LISIIVPTIGGREHYLEGCERAYRETTEDFELIVLRDYPTCGKAWNEGLRQAQGDYLHLSADDLEPHEGWWEAGIKWIERGAIPCPRILNSDGTLQSCGSEASEQETGSPSDVARVPFFSREMMQHIYPIFDRQYAGDYWITWKARQAGIPTLVVREMCFTHHMASEGRLQTLDADWHRFQRVTQ
jgi:hypothetical protein